MGFAQCKHQFYHSGTDSQKRADITVDLKRVDRKKILKWTEKEKRELLDWLNTCNKSYEAFKKEIMDLAFS